MPSQEMTRALPEPPNVLSDAAKDKWREMMPQLAERRSDWSQFELDLLLDYCRSYAFKECANLELQQLGSLTVQQRGLSIERPQCKIIRECEKTMDRIYRRLGFQKKVEYGAREENEIDLDND